MNMIEICVEHLLEGQKIDCDCIKISVDDKEEQRETISFEIICDLEFSLDLILPDWCKNFETHLNGEMVVNLSRDGIVKFDKMWKEGDLLKLILKKWD